MNTELKANKLTYQEKYSDGSGVEFEVQYSDEEYWHDKDIKGVVKLKHGDGFWVTFPITKLDWLIKCLQQVKSNVDG